jgi:LPPG:FO 2-phospho-L-lactate transferase
VGLHYGARSSGGLLDGWLVDDVDASAVPALEAIGVHTRAVPLWMRDVPSTAKMAASALEVALA